MEPKGGRKVDQDGGKVRKGDHPQTRIIDGLFARNHMSASRKPARNRPEADGKSRPDLGPEKWCLLEAFWPEKGAEGRPKVAKRRQKSANVGKKAAGKQAGNRRRFLGRNGHGILAWWARPAQCAAPALVALID